MLVEYLDKDVCACVRACVRVKMLCVILNVNILI